MKYSGVKKAIYLAENTTVFQKIGTKFTTSVLPGCENVPFRSDAYWECYIRTYSVTLHHIVGTCAMGKNDSKNAVVDSQLRVIGVKNLRVVDASVMPVVPVSNTQAPCIMIGEKGADLIIRTYAPRPPPTTTTTSTTTSPSVIVSNETIVEEIINTDGTSTTTTTVTPSLETNEIVVDPIISTEGTTTTTTTTTPPPETAPSASNETIVEQMSTEGTTTTVTTEENTVGLVGILKQVNSQRIRN